MAKKDKSSLYFGLFLLATLVIVILFIDNITAYVNNSLYLRLIPMDVVFDEGVDLKQYDGGVILNCLRDPKMCPPGVHYKDDITGEVHASNPDQPKTFQPVIGAPEPTSDMFVTDADGVKQIQNAINTADLMTNVIIMAIIGSITAGAVYFIHRHRKKA